MTWKKASCALLLSAGQLTTHNTILPKNIKGSSFQKKTCKFGVNVWVGRQRLGKSSPDNWGRRRVLVRSNIYEVPNQRCKCCLQLTDNCKNIEMSYNKLIKTINWSRLSLQKRWRLKKKEKPQRYDLCCFQRKLFFLGIISQTFGLFIPCNWGFPEAKVTLKIASFLFIKTFQPKLCGNKAAISIFCG